MFQLVGIILHFFGLGLLILSFFHSDVSFVSALLITILGYFVTAYFAPRRVNKKRR